MTVFRNAIFLAALAGLVAGLVMTGLQTFFTVPLILQAETYENAGGGHDHAAAAENHEHDHDAAGGAHEHDADAWMPADGAERTLFTALAKAGKHHAAAKKAGKAEETRVVLLSDGAPTKGITATGTGCEPAEQHQGDDKGPHEHGIHSSPMPTPADTIMCPFGVSRRASPRRRQVFHYGLTAGRQIQYNTALNLPLHPEPFPAC